MLCIERLKQGDEAEFSLLIDKYHRPLLQRARALVPSRAMAEDVVQETWLAIFEGLHRFEGRSTLKTWMFRILTYTAIRHAHKGSRQISIASEDGYGKLRSPHNPEGKLVTTGDVKTVDKAYRELPETQQNVVFLRLVEGWTSKEVCDELGLTSANQRVLLHRARHSLREALYQASA